MGQQSKQMIARDEAQEKLIAFLEAGKGEPLGVTADKFHRRGGTFDEHPDCPGTFLCEIERHRALPGSTYTKGLPMSAFETYIQRLQFDPIGETLEELPERHVSNSFDFESMASEHLDWDSRPMVFKLESWKKKRRITISACNFELETSSLKGACDKVEKCYRDWNLAFIFENMDLSDEQMQEYQKGLYDAIVSQALDCLKKGWEEPEPI